MCSGGGGVREGEKLEKFENVGEGEEIRLTGLLLSGGGGEVVNVGENDGKDDVEEDRERGGEVEKRRGEKGERRVKSCLGTEALEERDEKE